MITLVSMKIHVDLREVEERMYYCQDYMKKRT
jgi:hypothetical protein